MGRGSMWWAVRCATTTAVALVVGMVGGGAAYAQSTVAAWMMDEPAGATVMTDSSPDGFNGALRGDVVTGVAGVTGQAGDRAYRFNDGATCNASTGTQTGTGFVVVSSGVVGISTPTQPTFNPGSQPFSFSMWVNTTATPGTWICDLDLIRKGGGWKMEIFPFNHVAQPYCVWAGILNGTHVKVGLHKPLPVGAINNGMWHKITCQRTAGGEALIVDGATLASSSVDVGSISNKADVFIGSQSRAEDFYPGLIDETSFAVG